MPSEGRQPAVPFLGIRSQPIVDLPQRLDVQLMKPLPPHAPNAHQAGLAERVEVLRHRLARDRQAIGERRDRGRTTATQAVHEHPPGRIGDGLEDGIHPFNNMQPRGCMSTDDSEPTLADYDPGMRLTPGEEERLLIFTAAELARRRRGRGLPLAQPEAVAVICDAMLEAARDGASYEEVEAAGRAALTADDVMPGVRELIDQVRLEVPVGDGTRLVVLLDPIGDGAAPSVDGPGAIHQADGSPQPAGADRERTTLVVRNGSRRVVRVSSHYPFERVNPRLEFDRQAAAGFRLDLPSGGSLRWAPGETREVTLVRFGGEAGG
jgi:urease subunit gamma/beta